VSEGGEWISVAGSTRVGIAGRIYVLSNGIRNSFLCIYIGTIQGMTMEFATLFVLDHVVIFVPYYDTTYVALYPQTRPCGGRILPPQMSPKLAHSKTYFFVRASGRIDREVRQKFNF